MAYAMEHWTRGPTIGRGSTAVVSLATNAISGQQFAVKSTELCSSTLLQKEQCFLSKLSCPYIVEYLGCNVSIEDSRPMYNLGMEYMPGGTLSDAIRKAGGQLEESVIQSYTHQIVEGLEYLHGSGLVHSDIKSQNILVNDKCVKIGDLGFAKLVGKIAGGEAASATSSSISGTPVFMAPEVARGEEQGFESDIWALGCTMIEMCTGGRPWPEINDPVSALYRIGFSGDLPETPTRLSDKGKDFLSKCLMKDPRERWTAKQLLQHPFLEQQTKTQEFNFKESSKSVFTMSSPVSVLDGVLWDSFEAFESPKELQSIEGVCSNSPAERINRFIGGGGTCSTFSNVPNWEFDENWVTVRSNGDEESQNFVQCSDNVRISVDEPLAATTTSSNVAPSIVHQQLQTSNFVSDEEQFFTTIGSDERNVVREDDCVSKILDIIIGSDNQNFYFIHSHCFYPCFNFASKFLLFLFRLGFIFIPRAKIK